MKKQNWNLEEKLKKKFKEEKPRKLFRVQNGNQNKPI